MRPHRHPFNHFSRSALARLGYALAAAALLLNGGGAGLPGAAAQAAEAGEPAAAFSVFLPLVLQNGAPPAVASAQELIYEAWQAGQIDYPTALLYRAYATYADSRLPAAFRGAGAGEDLSLFAEIEAALPGLTLEQQAALNGFLARPNSPDSAIKGPPPPPPAGLTALAAAPAAAAAVAEFNCTPMDAEGTAWGSLASQTIPVRVHSLCYNNPGLDATLVIPLTQLTLSTLESLWGPMTQFMGVTPLRDGAVADDGGDDYIDFYLLYDDEVYPRGNPSVAFGGSELGFARPLLPRQGVAAPGLVGLRRSVAPDANGDTRGFRKTIAHEFFHLLQYARNEQFIPQGGAPYWFVEASATWAGWNFVPDARPLTHERFNGFQQSPLSLNVTGPHGATEHSHTYMAYIWPFFMHQEVNSYSISLAWQDIAGVNSWEAADQVLNDWVNFDANFPKFALRNLNNKARFGAAYDGHYVDFDPTFPDGQASPTIEVDALVLPGDSQAEVVELPNLKAKYYHYTVDPDVQRLQVDVQGLEPTAHFKAQMVAKIRGQGWRLIALLEGGVAEFCLDDPDQDIEEFYLVLSNSDMAAGNAITGTFTITDLAQPCVCGDFGSVTGFTGQTTFAYSYQASNAEWSYTVNHQAGGEAQLTLTDSTPHGRTYIGLLTGTGSGDDTEVDLTENPPDTETVQAAGPLMADYSGEVQSKFILNVDLDNCRYNVVVQSAVATASGLPYLLGTAYSGWQQPPADLNLAGSLSVPAHSVIWLVSQPEPTPAYWPGSDYSLVMFFNVVGLMNPAGEAQFTWTLTPAP